MKTNKKALLTVLCALLLVVASVMGTLAYLTDSESITNTFSVGKVEITMDETVVDAYGEAVKDTEGKSSTTTEGNAYKLIPGHTYVKDPTVHVQPGSEATYVFIKVENGISAIEKADATIANQITSTNSWTAYPNVAGVYYKEQAAVAKDAEAVNLKIFDSFTISDNADVSDYASATIKITACAVQKDGLELTKAYDEAVKAWTPANPEGGEG